MKSLIIANWKMNPKSLKEANKLFNSVKRGVKNTKDKEVVICPPFPYLSMVNGQMSNVSLGSQDCFWENEGAFTGEVSIAMLKSLGCKYVIVGHSERRKYFGETDETVNKKIKAALGAKLTPILCVGETKAQKEKAETIKALKKQIHTALKDVSSSSFRALQPIITYEPRWAIGSGNACSPDDAATIAIFFQKELQKIFAAAGKKARILYGGSVNAENAQDYLKEPSIQGVLVGGASLTSKEFIKIASPPPLLR